MKDRIKKIEFNRVGQKEGCSCDRCGQYIRNIWTVGFASGNTLNFGIDCFEKVYKCGSLTTYGVKEFKKLLKRIKAHKDGYNRWLVMTEEQARAESAVPLTIEDEESAFYGWSFEEYRNWKLTEFYGQRFKEDEKELAKFARIGFEV